MFIVNVKWKLLSFKLFIKIIIKKKREPQNYQFKNLKHPAGPTEYEHSTCIELANECCLAAHSSEQIQLKKKCVHVALLGALSLVNIAT